MITKSPAAMGYLHSAYAESLSEFGKPVFLERSGGWILKRPIPGTSYKDAQGCYPLFQCVDWSSLSFDFERLAGDIVSLVIVADPFGDYDENLLHKAFADQVVKYKQHFVADLHEPPESFVSRHHQRYTNRALSRICVDVSEQPAAFIDEWSRLYRQLVAKRDVSGIQAFSRQSLLAQLCVPGAVAFRAMDGDECVGMNVWYVQRDVGYYHLGAFAPKGYELHAGFALFWAAFRHFAATNIRWLNLGAGAGSWNDRSDGLTRFKSGWATGTRPTFLCGRVFDHKRYRELSTSAGHSSSKYFPAYRAGEAV